MVGTFFFYYLISLDWNGFQGSGSVSDFLALPLWLQNGCHRSRHHTLTPACPKTESGVTRVARMSFPQLPLFLPLPFFKIKGKNLSQKPPSRCSLVSPCLEWGHMITANRKGDWESNQTCSFSTMEGRQRE